MLPGDGITAGDGKDKTCYTTDDRYQFAYQGHGEPLNTTDIKEYIRNPHKFNIKPEMDGVYYNLWSTDNDKTVPNDEVVIKSVYDPSPVGYSLPASNAFSGFTTTGNGTNNPAEYNVKGSFDKGYYFYTKPNKQGLIFWFPAVGDRFYGTGINRLIYLYGHYWLAGTPTAWDGFCLILNESDLYINSSHLRSHGFSVRSAEERETHKFNTKLEMDGVYYNLWSTDNDRTAANDDVVIKSVYDPSPVGYSLPASNAFTGFTTTGGHTNNPAEFNVKGSYDKGWYFYTKPNKQGSTIFFPACGGRWPDNGILYLVTLHNICQLAGPGTNKQGLHFYFYSYSINTIYSNSRSYGFPVRSAEEKIVLVWLR